MKRLFDALEALKNEKIEPSSLRKALESVNLKEIDFSEKLKGFDLLSFNRIKLMSEPLEVFLMTWPPQFFYPIHQHASFWGFVIPVSGILSETLYGYAPNKQKVFIHPTKSYKTGDLIYEPFNVIHKLQNTSPIDPLITLHVYYPPVYSFADTMIFDAKNRRLAVLNEKAEDLSWDLPEEQYKLIQENAYDIEKLW